MNSLKKALKAVLLSLLLSQITAFGLENLQQSGSDTLSSIWKNCHSIRSIVWKGLPLGKV